MEKLISDESIKNMIHLKGNVIIYGAGGVGTALTERLLLEYPDLSLFIAVTAKDGYPYYLLGHKVYCIEELLDIVNDCSVIIATLEKAQETIARHLESLGFQNIYGISDGLYEERKYSWKEVEGFENKELLYAQRYLQPYIKNVMQICENRQVETDQVKKYVEQAVENLKSDRLYLADLIIPLSNKCTLRCRDCNNLMPYFKSPRDLDVEKILRSLEILLAKADAVLRCELIGGEPFIAKHLYTVLDYLLNKGNVYDIKITTNGTVLPKQEYVPLLQNPKVRVEISDYGTLVDKQKFVNYLEEYKIAYDVLGIEHWISSGMTEKRNRDVQELQKMYRKCYAGYFCKTLYEDKLFACSRASSLYALECMREPEFIEIKETTSIEELKEFLIKPYSIACDYCDRTENIVYVEPAIQLEH